MCTSLAPRSGKRLLKLVFVLIQLIGSIRPRFDV